MRTVENRIGEKFVTNEGYIIEIVSYKSQKEVTIKFEDGTLIRDKPYIDIRKGKIKNPYHKSTYGIGYFGEGDYKSGSNRKMHNYYVAWANILNRCYNKQHQEKYQPTYSGCSVADRWHNFQVFAEWFCTNHKDGFALDKDILVKGNKIYSPETCCFVPQEINNVLTKTNILRGDLPIGVRKEGNKYAAEVKRKLSDTLRKHRIGVFDTPEEAFQAYKIAKEAYIKEVADKYKNQITEQVYQALYNYKVEITD